MIKTQLLNPMFYAFIACFTIVQAGCSRGIGHTASNIITADQLIEEIKKEQPVTYHDVTFEGDINLLDIGLAQLTPNNFVASIASPLYFERCEFKGKLIGFDHQGDTARVSHFLSAVSFINCRFETEIDLRGSTFDHHLYFNTSLFDKNVQLQAIKIAGDFRMEKAMFSEGLFLQEAVFSGNFWAKDATVLGQFSVQQADFWQNSVFAGLEVRGYADFGLTHFRRSAFFEYGKYDERANYSGAIFRHRAEWTQAQYEKHVDFSNAWFAYKPVFAGIKQKELFTIVNARFDGGKPDNDFLFEN